jgi:hypothetical protein
MWKNLKKLVRQTVGFSVFSGLCFRLTALGADSSLDSRRKVFLSKQTLKMSSLGG